MVRTSLLSNILVVGTCCLEAASFTPESPNLHHVRLDRLLINDNPNTIEVHVVSSFTTLSDAPILVRTVEQPSLDQEEDSSVAVVRDLPPILQQITDERRNFQRNLGKAMDTLRKDMPYILKSQPGKCCLLVEQQTAGNGFNCALFSPFRSIAWETNVYRL